MNRLNWLFAIAFVITVPAASSAQDDLGAKALQIMEKHCFDCHANEAAEGSFGYADNIATMIAKRKVVPGNLAQSRVFIRLQSGEMPPEGEEPTGERPTPAEIQTLESWIAAGAPKPGVKPNVAVARPFVALADEFDAAFRYLRNVERADQEYIRFFSLRNWHNSQRTPKDIDHCRAALGKVVNSLSWRQRLVTPKRLDEHGTLYAFDIRDLTWTQNVWDELLSYYPYGLKHDHYPDDPRLNQLARDVYEMTQTDIPIIRGDWFIARATRPPIYHVLLQIPETDVELERRLGVNAEKNILQARVARAGMVRSGISTQHRMVERHDATHGYYWKSYDFRPTSRRGDLTLFPLGPKFTQNPYPHLAFEHDGGELIFRLPNGLQGYMLIDGNGKRIDEGPADVVADRNRVSGDTRIVNGVSCMACHAQGMVDFEDVVRDSTALGGRSLDLLRRMYPKRDSMAKLVADDRELFRSAVSRAMGTMVVDRDQLRTADGAPIEPVTALAKYYATQSLDLNELAAELGMQDPKELAAALKFDQRFRAIGLGPVASGRGEMKRILWEDASRGFRSPYQRAAAILRLGQPKAVARTLP